MQIEVTKDYAMFRAPATQRPLNENRVEQIAESMRERGFIPGYHILVTKEYEVVDGQHRLAAAERARVPVYYMFEETIEHKDVPVLARLAKAWTAQDYLDAYVKRGAPDYVALAKFCEDHGVKIHTMLGLLGTGEDAKIIKQAFYNGTMKLSDERLSFARLVFQRLKDFAPYADGFLTTTSFVLTVRNLSQNPKYDHDRMIGKLEVQGNRLVRCANTKDYIRLMQDIYNYRARKHVNLLTRLEDE